MKGWQGLKKLEFLIFEKINFEAIWPENLLQMNIISFLKWTFSIIEPVVKINIEQVYLQYFFCHFVTPIQIQSFLKTQSHFCKNPPKCLNPKMIPLNQSLVNSY